MVASLTIGCEGEARMVGIDRSIQVAAVTNFTGGRSANVLDTITGLVAGFAVYGSMDTGQGEAAFGMLLEQLGHRLPIPRDMAVLTVLSQLSFVMVGMAIGTSCPHVAE